MNDYGATWLIITICLSFQMGSYLCISLPRELTGDSFVDVCETSTSLPKELTSEMIDEIMDVKNKSTVFSKIASGVESVIEIHQFGDDMKCIVKTSRNFWESDTVKIINILGKQTEYMPEIYHVQRNHGITSLVMEYCPMGDLFGISISSKRKMLPESVIQHLFSEMVHCVKYFHDNQIIHLDIKPENFLINNKGKVVICDVNDCAKVANAKFLSLVECVRGTTIYVSPEIRQSKHKISGKSDIFALGICLGAMFTRSNSFDSMSLKPINEVIDLHLHDVADPFRDNISNASIYAVDLIKHMIVASHKKRYDIEQVLNHPWLKNAPKLNTTIAGDVITFSDNNSHSYICHTLSE